MKKSLSDRIVVTATKYDLQVGLVKRELADGRPVRWKDLSILGVSQSYAARMVDRGVLEKIERGTYQLSYDHRCEYRPEDGEEDTLEVDEGALEEFQEALSQAPNGHICLLSAARFHDLTVEAPSEIWIGLPHGSHVPKPEGIPIKVVVSRKAAAKTLGIQEFRFRGSDVRVTDLERTVVDLYGYASRLGDATLPRKALSEAMRKDGFSRSNLYQYSRKLGVDKRVRHDVETLDLIARPGEESSPEGSAFGLGASFG